MVKADEIPGSPKYSPLIKDNLPRVVAWCKRVLFKIIPGGFRKIAQPLRQALSSPPQPDALIQRRYKTADIRHNIPGADEVYINARLQAALVALSAEEMPAREFNVKAVSLGGGEFRIETNSKDPQLAAKIAAQLHHDPEFAEALAANIGHDPHEGLTPTQVEFSLKRENASHENEPRWIVEQARFNRIWPSTSAAEAPATPTPARTLREKVAQDLLNGKKPYSAFADNFTEKNGWKGLYDRSLSYAKEGEALKYLQVAMLSKSGDIYVGKAIGVDTSEVGTRYYTNGREDMRTVHTYTIQMESGATVSLNSDEVSTSDIRVDISGIAPLAEEYERKYRSWSTVGSWRIAPYPLHRKKVALHVSRSDKHGVSAIIEGTIVGFLGAYDDKRILLEDELAERYYNAEVGAFEVLLSDPRLTQRCEWLLTSRTNPAVVAVRREHIQELRMLQPQATITSEEFASRFAKWHQVSTQDLGHPANQNRKVALLVKPNQYGKGPRLVEGTFKSLGKADVRLDQRGYAENPSSVPVRYAEIEIANEGPRKFPLEDIETVRIEPEAALDRLHW